MADYINKDRYGIEGMLPFGRVHLLGGPSGVGKTTLMIHVAEQWMAGDTVFGHPTRGQDSGQFFFLATDRGEEETDETFARVGVDPKSIPHKATLTDTYTIEEFFDMAPDDTKILFVEGADALTNSMIDFQNVASFLKRCGKIAEARDMAIWLSVGMPKCKIGDHYANPREQVIGSSAWARFTSTIFNLQQSDPDAPVDPDRVLLVLPKNCPALTFYFTMDGRGRLIPAPTPEDADFRAKLLSKMSSYDWFDMGDLMEYAKSLEISERTLRRILSGWVQSGECEKQIEKGKKYQYRRVPILLTKKI